MRRHRGFSLVEVLISLVLITLVGVAAMRTYMLTAEMTFVESLQATALYHCQEVIEAMLADDFENLTADHPEYQDEYGLVLDTRGTEDPSDDIYLDRIVSFNDPGLPGRVAVDVTVTVTFHAAGRALTESLDTRIVGAGR